MYHHICVKDEQQIYVSYLYGVQQGRYRRQEKDLYIARCGISALLK